MRKELCPFGPAFAEQRKHIGMSLWQLCLRLGYQPRNFQRIEKGTQEPRLTVALLMLDGLRIGYGDFFEGLARAIGLCDSSSRPMLILSEFSPLNEKSLTYIFGRLLVAARKQNGLTQASLSERVGYHLRNLTKIENGTQEPRVLTALKLVVATDCNIKEFFDKLKVLITD